MIGLNWIRQKVTGNWTEITLKSNHFQGWREVQISHFYQSVAIDPIITVVKLTQLYVVVLVNSTPVVIH